MNIADDDAIAGNRSGMQSNVQTRTRKDSVSVLSAAGSAYTSMGVTYR